MVDELKSRLDLESLFHLDYGLNDMDVKQLGQEVVHNLYSCAPCLTQVGSDLLWDFILVYRRLLLSFREALRYWVVRLLIDFLIQLFDQFFIFLTKSSSALNIIIEQSTQPPLLGRLLEDTNQCLQRLE